MRVINTIPWGNQDIMALDKYKNIQWVNCYAELWGIDPKESIIIVKKEDQTQGEIDSINTINYGKLTKSIGSK